MKRGGKRMDKKAYEEAEIEVLLIAAEDVITTSPGDGTDWPEIG